MTFVSDDITIDRPITPNHFLIGEEKSFQDHMMETPKSITPTALSNLYAESKERLNWFWKVWSTDYLRNLPCIVPQFEEKGSLKVGSIVLVQEDNIPRLGWVMGRVTELFPGRDGKICCVKLQTPKGFLIRAVQRLYKLEFLEPMFEETNQVQESPVACERREIVSESGIPKSIVNIPDTGSVDSEINHNEPRVSRFGRKLKPVVKMDL